MKIASSGLISLACLLGAAAVPAVQASETPHLARSLTTSGASLQAGKRVPQQRFGQHDFVVQLSDFDWEAVGESAGEHRVEWRWYQGDKLVSQTDKKLNFNSTPYTLWTRRAAATLGSGHFKVEAVIDGEVAAVSEFDIAP